jgi:hypothetical protein
MFKHSRAPLTALAAALDMLSHHMHTPYLLEDASATRWSLIYVLMAQGAANKPRGFVV